MNLFLENLFGGFQDEPHFVVNDAFSIILRISLDERAYTTPVLASYRGQN